MKFIDELTISMEKNQRRETEADVSVNNKIIQTLSVDIWSQAVRLLHCWYLNPLCNPNAQPYSCHISFLHKQQHLAHRGCTQTTLCGKIFQKARQTGFHRLNVYVFYNCAMSCCYFILKSYSDNIMIMVQTSKNLSLQSCWIRCRLGLIGRTKYDTD